MITTGSNFQPKGKCKCFFLTWFGVIARRYEEDMYWRRVEEEQHHWDDRRRLPDGGYPQGPPGLLGVRPGMPGLQPQGPVV